MPHPLDLPAVRSGRWRRVRPVLTAMVLAIGPLATHPARGETVELQLPSGRIATADLRSGLRGLPAVLILHGFLQTREFSTVRRLAEGLEEIGYTVLVPTLSLDIDRRAQSLPCEAIHTHSMESEADELHAWLDWLAQVTPAPIVTVGHSAGGLQLLAQATLRPHPRVVGLVPISLTYFGAGASDLEGDPDRRRAESDLAQGVDTPRDYALTYCARYPTLPGHYLSYVRWDRERTLAAVRGSGVPIEVILGEQDNRIDWGWIDELAQAGATVRRVPTANHFFDAIDELDLLDAVEASLRALGSGPPP